MKEAGMPAIQINTGGLCHLEGNMIMEAVDAFDQAVGLENIDVIFIENVGNWSAQSTLTWARTCPS